MTEQEALLHDLETQLSDMIGEAQTLLLHVQRCADHARRLMVLRGSSDEM
jgi:hypothetical protein